MARYMMQHDFNKKRKLKVINERYLEKAGDTSVIPFANGIIPATPATSLAADPRSSNSTGGNSSSSTLSSFSGGAFTSLEPTSVVLLNFIL